MSFFNSIKKLINASYILYTDNVSNNTGKYFIGNALYKTFGDAEYTIEGLKFGLHPVALIEKKLIKDNKHDEVVTRLINDLSGKDIFVDIGANFGYFSLIAGKRKLNVIAFEPSVRELNKMYRHLIKNNVSTVSVFPFALGENNEPATFNIAFQGNPGMNSFVNIPTRTSAQLKIDKVRFDSLFSDEIYQRIRLCKVDVEGFEMYVLRGFERCIDKMQNCTFVVEITESFLKIAGGSSKDIYDFFESRGFKPQFGINFSGQYDEIFFR